MTQTLSRMAYASAVGFDTKSDPRRYQGGNLVPHYNMAPGSWPWMLHRLHLGREEMDTVRFGFEPPEDGARMFKAVGIDFAMRERYFRHMWREGRAIVPIEGYHELPPDGSNPWYVRLQEGGIMLCAVISSFRPYKPERLPGMGWCFVTAGQLGFGNPRDLVPVILSPQDARAWMDPATSAEDAEQLARTKALSANAFHAFRVSKRVLSDGVNDEGLIAPV
ncbi:SOS response-associated peptidase family protein [Noviherbaspirillum galbum]|uniref:SOS response-associated peptidase family protein n=1 Tax=Noviherbaspirillum galbum TaxID=2709383 RepID=UPI001969CF4C|nr:SOS response-associated peptidase family protein [Noviherbaspirillum galbum]